MAPVTASQNKYFTPKGWLQPNARWDLCSRLFALSATMLNTGWHRITGLFTFVVEVLYFYNKTRKYDKVCVASRTLVKVVLKVHSTGCNNERQSFAKLSYSVINNVSTNLFPAALQDFFHVLNDSNVTTMVNNLLECSPDRIVYWAIWRPINAELMHYCH